MFRAVVNIIFTIRCVKRDFVPLNIFLLFFTLFVTKSVVREAIEK